MQTKRINITEPKRGVENTASGAGSLEQYLTRNRNKQNNGVAKENTGIIQHKANVLPQKNSHTTHLFPIYQSAYSLL